MLGGTINILKYIGLLIAGLLLLGGIFRLVVYSFPTLTFSFVSLGIYLGIGLVAYAIVWLVGTSLDKAFNNSVEEFLRGKKTVLFDDKPLLNVFGAVIITFWPFLVYLLLFAFFATVIFLMIAFYFVINLPRIPIALLILIPLIGLLTAFAILTGFFRLLFPKRGQSPGIEIKKNEQPRLWELTKQLADEIQSKPVDKIIIAPKPGIGVYLEGNLFSTMLGGGKRVLLIGVPSLHELTVDEFKSILAHEYGHFSNKDTQWSSFTFSMGNSLLSSFRQMPGPIQFRTGSAAYDWLRTHLNLTYWNPAYWIMFVFIKLFFRITSGFSRIREVMADIRAMTLYGGKALSNALQKVALNDTIFSQVVESKLVPQFLQQNKAFTNFSAVMEQLYTKVDKSELEKYKSDIISKSETHDIYDSHPALKVRLDYAKKFGEKEEKDKRPVKSIFDDWDKLNELVATIYNLQLFTFLKTLALAQQAREK